MNNYVISEIDSAQKKMGAYVALLNYRYMNLCVKAELGALMPVTVFVGNEPYNIEDVANINSPNEYQFGIYPKNGNNLQNIIHGIYEAHPEFKMEIKSTDGSDDADKRFILYTMPDVDENRRDFLKEGVKSLHEECYVRIDAIHAEIKAGLLENLTEANLPKEEIDEALKALDETRKNSQDMINEQLLKKQEEIDRGYEHYQEECVRKEEEAAANFDFTKGFRMNYDE